jgi:heptosyltransferase I
LGIDDIQLRWDLPVGAEDYEWAKAQLPDKRPILVVNPAASKAERSWPVERYIETIKRVQESWAVQVVLTGGPGAYDRQLADRILAEVAAIDLVGKTRPKQLLAVIGSADAVLCPDTGPSHMAAAMGTPVVALHAVTSAQVSGPYPFRHLAVDYYPQAVESVLKTSMDKVVWGTHAHGEETMSLVPVDQVVQRLASLFEARGCPTSHT